MVTCAIFPPLRSRAHWQSELPDTLTEVYWEPPFGVAPWDRTILVHFAGAVMPPIFADDQSSLMNREFIDTPRNCFNTSSPQKPIFWAHSGL
jgi:hypothetical protein